MPAPPRLSPVGDAQDLKKQATTWLAISLFSSIFCTSLCVGIGGAVFCYLAMQAAEHGAMEDASAKLKWGKILTVAGSVLGLLASAVSLALSA